MSSLYSDPPFPRGSTLLSGEVIETDGAGPVAGRAVVGQVKVFQDVNPSTKALLSDRLVYCVAARYKGSDNPDVTGVASGSTLVTGNIYLFDTGAPLEQFGNATGPLATATNLTAGLTYGVLDEYLTGALRTNDIVWLVVKGPTAIRQSAAIIAVGAAVQASATAGSMAVYSSGTPIGQNISGAATTASAQSVRVNLSSTYI